jgi:regulator of protease activity HflC (stomatin/prohibitin superfamily)
MTQPDEMQLDERDAQLTQRRVPLELAAEAFATRSADGTTPIVIVPERLVRLQVGALVLGGVLVTGGIVGGMTVGLNWTVGVALAIGAVVLLLGLYRSFYVAIPEGVNALLALGGRYMRTLGSGPHVLPPWMIVTHLVSRREIPFDVLVAEAPTSDDVRVSVDALITFTIKDPQRFVYNVSPDDFDRVLQAACQDVLRKLVRQIEVAAVNDLVRRDLADLRDALNAYAERYGINVVTITITYAQPPTDFMASQEARRLALIQQAEQAERQALAMRLQADEATLVRQRIIAQVEQAREELKLELQRAEARRSVLGLEAENEALRLAKLQERLQQFPEATAWDWQSQQLEVARALAANTRAMVQFGGANALTRPLIIQELVTPAPDDEAALPRPVVTSNGEGETATPQPGAARNSQRRGRSARGTGDAS